MRALSEGPVNKFHVRDIPEAEVRRNGILFRFVPSTDIRPLLLSRMDTLNTHGQSPSMTMGTQRRLAAIISACVVGYSRLMSPFKWIQNNFLVQIWVSTNVIQPAAF